MSGRRALDRRSKTAPDPASHEPSGRGWASNSSYRTCTRHGRRRGRAGRRPNREPPSIGAFGGMGYGPASLSSSQRKCTGTRGWLAADGRERDADRAPLPQAAPEVGVHGAAEAHRRDVRGGARMDGEPAHVRVPDVVGGEVGTGRRLRQRVRCHGSRGDERGGRGDGDGCGDTRGAGTHTRGSASRAVRLSARPQAGADDPQGCATCAPQGRPLKVPVGGGGRRGRRRRASAPAAGTPWAGAAMRRLRVHDLVARHRRPAIGQHRPLALGGAEPRRPRLSAGRG